MNAGESQKVTFSFSTDEFKYYDRRKREFVIESGEFKLWIAKHAHDKENEIVISVE